MSSASRNLSDYDPAQVHSGSGMRIALVVSSWNQDITEALYEGAEKTLRQLGCTTEHIHRLNVPGSFELPLAAKWVAEFRKPDAVICIGCVIQGETRHFDFICEAVSNGIMDLNLSLSLPVIFCVLTSATIDQARERAGGKYGNKGTEAAVSAVQMVALKNQLKG